MPHEAAIGQHYDDLDPFYREIWGEHLHHGLWLSGKETPEESAHQLTELAIRLARVAPGNRVCDVGCGYGATARILAREYGASVTALTLSEAQYAYARTLGGGVEYRLQDWLSSGLPAECFDAVLAIECVSHMIDRQRFFSEAYRVLRPGGRLVVCAWLAGARPALWQQHLLLASIIRDGRLAGLDPASTYRERLTRAGFAVDLFEDLTPNVQKTWLVCMRRLARRLLADRRYRRYLRNPAAVNRRFALVLPRIYLAYRAGAMHYGVFSARKPPLHAAPHNGLTL